MEIKVNTPYFEIGIEEHWQDGYTLIMGSYRFENPNIEDLEKLKSRIDMVIEYLKSEQ